jgi:hypothetical protein
VTAPTVIVAREKHGIVIYESALNVLRQRAEIEADDWYDEAEVEDARAIIARADEDDAWRFLMECAHREYEGVEKQVVR